MISLSAVVALSVAVGQPPDSGPVAKELTGIVQRLAAAWKGGECDAWGQFIAPEWSVTHINGAVITRDEALKMCRSQETPIAGMTSDELSVRVFGDAAVVTGRTIATTGGATPETITLRFTDVFVRRGGRWQAVASQATRLAP